MSNTKSSIEWLVEKLLDHGYGIPKEWREEAKAMHKEEMINSILDNRNITSQVTFKDAEQYYNETFEGGNK